MPTPKPKASAQLNAARRHLGDHQLIAFLRAVGPGGQNAVSTTLRKLDAGHSLEDLFPSMEPKGRGPDRDSFRIELRVKPVAAHIFLITFGHHGPLAGDGGTWLVEFGPDGAVQRLERQTFWIH